MARHLAWVALTIKQVERLMQLLDSLRWRYATKQFDTEKELNDQQLDGLLEAANLAATSYGLQPFKFVVINDQEILDRLVASSYGQTQIAEASHVIVIATRTDVDADYISKYVDLMESERGLPGGALDQYKSVMTGSITKMDDDALNIWATKQAYIALGTLLAACADAKIDACPMEGIVASEYDEHLGLAKMNLRTAVAVPVGFRAKEDAHQTYKKVRQPLSEIVVKV